LKGKNNPSIFLSYCETVVTALRLKGKNNKINLVKQMITVVTALRLKGKNNGMLRDVLIR